MFQNVRSDPERRLARARPVGVEPEQHGDQRQDPRHRVAAQLQPQQPGRGQRDRRATRAAAAGRTGASVAAVMPGRRRRPRRREHRAVAALQRRIARRAGALAPGGQLLRACRGRRSCPAPSTRPAAQAAPTSSTRCVLTIDGRALAEVAQQRRGTRLAARGPAPRSARPAAAAPARSRSPARSRPGAASRPTACAAWPAPCRRARPARRRPRPRAGTRRRRHLLEQREVLDELGHGEPRVVAEVLRQVAEPAADLPPLRVGAGITVEQPQPARGRRDHRGQHPQQRGLARAVRAPADRTPPARPPDSPPRRPSVRPNRRVTSVISMFMTFLSGVSGRIAATTARADSRAGHDRRRTATQSVTAAANRPVAACPASTVMHHAGQARRHADVRRAGHASRPPERAPRPRSSAPASRTSRAAAAPDAADAASPERRVERKHAPAPAPAAPSGRSPPCCSDSSHAGSMPGPVRVCDARPPASAGASSAT